MKFAASSMIENLRRVLSCKNLALALAVLVIFNLFSAVAFAQCTLNGNPVTCVLTGPLTITSYNDGTGNTTTSSGALTDNGTMSILGYIELVGDTSLSGPGTLTLTNGQIGTNSNGYTLTNGSTIQGSGVVGSNAGPVYQNLSLNNSGTIDANSSGNTLAIQGTGGSIVNSGILEATSGGILNLATTAALNNNGGTISAIGTNSVVNVSTSIQGGTLSTSGGGVMQTFGGATLDGTSQGAITVSDGSKYTAGAAGSATITKVTGALDLGTVSGGTLALGGALELIGNTTVTTPGSGSITMTNGQIGTDSNGYTLTNTGLIRGSGVIGSNSATYQNLSLNNTGSISANAIGKTLSIQGTGGSIINSGTLRATAGGILNLATTAAINNIGGTITATGTSSVVNVSTTIQGGTLSTSAGGVMQTSGGATLDATNHGAITLSDGSTYTAGAAGSGTITNITGTLNLGTVSGSTLALGGALELVSDTTVVTPGTGSITMANGQIGTNSNAYTLTNNGLIQGSGVIGSNNTTYQNLSLNNTGTINANSSGNTLSIQGTGGSIINAGLFEATNGGTLNLATATAINNAGKTISATGTNSVVNVSTTIQGGTLSTSGSGVMQTSGGATLDGLSLGAITLADKSTYTAGAAGSGTITNIAGTLNVKGSNVALGGALELINNTTIAATGAGSITMTNGQIGTNSNGYTLNSNGLIQGSGVIGSNNTTYQNLSLNNTGTINANSSGNTLSIQGTGGSIINASLFEATSGGILNLATTSPINNQNGTILAGTGSTVNVTNTDIQGGILTTQGTGVMQSSGTVTLDAVTLGAITLSDGSTYLAGANTLTNITGQLNLGVTTGSTLQVSSGTGTNYGYFRLVGNTTVSGPGSMVLSGGLLGTNSNGYTLTNGSTIQGYGVIGSNIGSDYQNLSLNNTATINANSTGNTLSIQGTGGSIINAGLFEATNGGTLNLATTSPINNSAGNITASGAGSTVNVTTAIQGGTLNTSGGGVMQTVTGAQLDGVTNGAITISDGSTYTAGAGTLTDVQGALKFGTATGGTLALSGNLRLIGDTTLSGPGSMTLSGAAQIGTNSNAYTLTNNSTIQGTGLIGSGIGSLYSNDNLTNGGSIIANGGTLTLAGTGTLTNTGTLHANAGTTLVSTMSGLSSSTFSGTTLLTGTYVADAGATLQINALGNTGGEIVTNDGHIILNGVGSSFVDAAGKDVLSSFNTNATGSGFTITGGRNFTTAGNFTNNGTLTVGSGSAFIVNGNLTNLASNTLTGGIYSISGTFQFNGANIVNNSASITLNGSTSKIIAKNGTSGLVNFAKNTALGTFALTGGRSFTTLGNFTNNGVLTVGSGSKFDVNGSLTNFAGTTLTGGTYNVTGTLQFNGANIVTNAANITLTGAASKIVDQSGTTNGLANFAANAAAGSFTLASGRNLTTAGAFSNAGTLKVSTGTTFTVASGQSYTQTAGKTVDDGTMAVTGGGAFAINTGSVFGNKGTFSGNLTSGGVFNIGDAANLAGKMAVTGNYVQSSTGTLKADVGGLAAGTKFDQLNVTGAVTLGGTLSLQLINSFVPTLGSTFDIMNFASETGNFATITGAHINANEHFAVVVNPTNVTLDVVAGPSPWRVASAAPSPTPEPSSLLLLGSGLAGLFVYRRKSKGA
jgi:hypothetical protein